MLKNKSTFSNKVLLLILSTSVFKLLIAGLLELGNDEVYYWTYALQLDWNHFDHPPLIGFLIRLTTLNLHWVSEISMRLGSILGAGLSTWFVYKTVQIFASEKAGFFAAIIYQSSIYSGIIAGLFILPDSPQMPIWTAAMFCMAILINQPTAEKKTGVWVLLGFLIGLATLSKVHALYLWVGFGLTILFCRTKWLLSWRFYLSILVTLICLIPIVFWNVQYDFITYKFHSERVTHTQLQWDMLVREVAGEFVYQNPIVFILLLIALVGFLRKTFTIENKSNFIWIICMSIPMILLFWVIALFNPTLPHWSGPGYIPLYFLAAIYLEKKSINRTPRVLTFAGLFVVILLIIATGIVRLSPVNFGSHEKENFGEYCPTLDLSGWSDFSKEYAKLVSADKQQHLMQPNSFIIVPKWFPGGHLEFYTAPLTNQTLIAIGPLQDIHKFAWLNRDRKKLQIGDDAYVIVPSNLPLNVMQLYGEYFTEIQTPVPINQIRNGGIVRYFYVYRLKGCKKLPREQIQ